MLRLQKRLLRLHSSERGSLTLSSEALLLLVLGAIGFAGMTLLLSRTESKMEERSKWVECPSVLDCEHITPPFQNADPER